MAKHALRYSDDVKTNYHKKVHILCGGKSVGNDNVDYFSLGECHHNARARENQPGFRRWRHIDRQKIKFLITLLRFFSLRNAIVKVILGECHHNARARGNQPGFRR